MHRYASNKKAKFLDTFGCHDAPVRVEMAHKKSLAVHDVGALQKLKI